MDGHASVVIMSKICAFAEVLWPDSETTQITRGADDYADNYGCEIYTRRHCFELRSGGGHVRLNAAALDSLTESSLLCEVSAIDEHALSTLRTVLAATEAIAEMRASKNTSGMTMLGHMINDALPVDRRRYWLWVHGEASG
jgi:hypothetical protein